jgi:3-hydroxyisobutyrate dehydrogenase-like beta-hydroxyacid dehydrogenase
MTPRRGFTPDGRRPADWRSDVGVSGEARPVVAVVGLGAMGSRIAGRLLSAGHGVVVWNRDATKTVSLRASGAVAAASPAEATRRADVVITIVRDEQALSDVTEGSNGIVAGATGATTVIQMSTVGPAAVSRLAAALEGRTNLLDAPVLGSVTEADAGTLTIFVGGETELVERWTPLLSVLGSVLKAGPLGAGTAAKLVANSTLFGVLGVLGEAPALADGLDLSREIAFAVLATTPLAPQAARRREAIESGEYPRRFALALARKDADLILEAARGARIDLRLLPATRAWFADAERWGAAAQDYTAVLAAILSERNRRARSAPLGAKDSVSNSPRWPT